LQSCQAIDIEVFEIRSLIKYVACNLYFVCYSVTKCILWLECTFQRNLFGQDDAVPLSHLHFLLLGFRQLPWPGRTGVGGTCPMIRPPPSRGYATVWSHNGVRVPVAVEAGCKLPYSVYLLTSLPRSVQPCLPGSLLWPADPNVHRQTTLHRRLALCIAMPTTIPAKIAKFFDKSQLLLVNFVCYFTRYRVIYFQCLCYLALPLCVVSMHLTRCVLWHVVYVSFSFVFLISCFWSCNLCE